MKKIIAFLVATLFGGAAIHAQTMDKEGHVLVREWEIFTRAYKADKPQDALRALDVIITEASAQGLLWDLYEASNRKVEIGGRVNWKDIPQLRSERQRTFENCGNPMLLWLLDGYGLDDINARKAILQSSHNNAFYLKDDFLQNDYEFLLWRLFLNDHGGERSAKIYAQCREHFGPVMEMYGRMKELDLRFSLLTLNQAGQSQYRELRADCVSFEKERSALKGRDKAIAANFYRVKYVIEEMDGKELYALVKKDTLYMLFRNLASANVQISTDKGKVLYAKKIRNDAKSYYVADTVKIPLPALDDGEYRVNVAKGVIRETGEFTQNRLSAYITRHSDGWKLYAADYKSGKPLEGFEVLLYSAKGAILASADGLSCKDGMVSLPDEFAGIMDAQDMMQPDYIVCRYRGDDGFLRSTAELHFADRHFSGKVELSESQPYRAHILHDSGAYHRGDKVNVKAILYSGLYSDETAVAAAGTAFSVLLMNPRGEQCGICELTTDEYGSAVCAFNIPSDAEGGRYDITVKVGNRLVSRDRIVVDDYVLPDFECVFEKVEGMYFQGDTVTVRGRVQAYSGHNVRIAGASYRIGTDKKSYNLEMAPDGSFAVQVPLLEGRWWTDLTILVNSATGQTLEFSKQLEPCHANFEVDVKNRIEASVDGDGAFYVVSDDYALFDITLRNSDSVPQKMNIGYTLTRNGKPVARDSVAIPCLAKIPLPEAGGNYNIVFEARVRDSKGQPHSMQSEIGIVKFTGGSTALDADVESIFVPHSDALACDFGTTKGELWGLALLYGKNDELLHSQCLHLTGERGREGSLCTVNLPYDAGYPDTVVLRILYFRDGRFHKIDHVFNRPQQADPLDIKWERFTDEAVPGAEYSISFKGSPAAQYAAVIFDRSTEAFAPNIWRAARRIARIPSVPYNNALSGEISGSLCLPILMDGLHYSFAKSGRSTMGGEEIVEEEIVQLEAVREDEVKAREDFATTICWAPLIMPDADGRGEIRFRTSDKTGSFAVQIFAHEKDMGSAAVRREMLVSLPVQLSVAHPQLLRSGDRYVLKVVVSNRGAALGGKVVLEAKGMGRYSKTVKLPAQQSAQVQFALDLPDGMEMLEVKLVFTDSANTVSDALAFRVPVQGRMQTITESHSAVYLAGDSKDAIVAGLRKQFVNMSSYGAQYSELSISDMLQQMLSSYEGTGDGDSCNSLALSRDICAAAMYDALRGTKTDVDALARRLASFQNEDGGLAWFQGMRSSAAVTAVILERFAQAGVQDCIDEAKAAAFLDKAVTEGGNAWARFLPWDGSISLAQYAYVRSLYPQYAFAAKVSRDFAKDMREYLVPAGDRGLQGSVYAKTLRLSALRNLISADGGMALADAWGAAASRKALEESCRADMASLEQYAVRHASGGIYYPNLVMPYRGLLASEAYCHSLLARLMDSENPAIAKGIRIWLMVQKETQHWDSGFEFVNAVATILDGPADVLETRVIVMTKTGEKPYSQLKAAGNGFRIGVEYSVVSADGKLRVLKDGDALNAGDKLTASYIIWSGENRSFVKLTAPRPACLTPVDQLSGHYLWWGEGYRQVLADRTEYYFDRFSEEDSKISEQFFVNQSGTFTAPVVQIECLYAPEYRANAAYGGKITVR